MKLTCGLEMLASHSSAKKANQIQKSLSKVTSEKFEAFVKNLNKNGYFQGELEGSKKYTELLDRAKNFYQGSIENVQESSGTRFSTDVLEIVKNYRHDALKELDPDDNLPSDDESWLDINPESFDDLLKQHFKLGSNPPGATCRSETTELPQEIKKFLQCLSDYDGIQVFVEIKNYIVFIIRLKNI